MGIIVRVLWLCTCVVIGSASIEQIDLNYTASVRAYDELYEDAMRAYDREDHANAAVYLERAIADYRHENEVRAQCRLQCDSKFHTTQAHYARYVAGEVAYLHYFVKMKSCAETCVERFVGKRGRVARSIRQTFEQREPYNYIQYSYYKIGEYEKSLQAAYTYLERHPTNQLMRENVDFMLGRLGKTNDSVTSLEEYPHVTLYKAGEKSYARQDIQSCIIHFEDSLALFYKEMEKCQSRCEEQHEDKQASYTTALFGHFKAILDCRHECRKKLTTVNGQASLRTFVPYYFHYLQYCYFQADRVLDAAINAETYLMFVPDDVTMNTNMAYYKKQPQVVHKELKPRKLAERYFKQFTLELTLAAAAKGPALPMVTEDDKEQHKEDEKRLDHVYESVVVGIQESKKGEQLKDAAIMTDLEYRDKTRWRRNDLTKKATLIMDEIALNGTGKERVAFDGVATEQECQLLMKLVKELSRNSKIKLLNRRRKQLEEMETAISGDGYKHNHKERADRPFTEKEEFKGITVDGAVDAAIAKKISVEEAELYARMSERVRLLTQEYFDMRLKLNFAFTHLVCRHALEDEMVSGEEHISHPIHSDNCLLGGDGEGTCPQRSPAYTWRDYSALLYLNSDFDGGDFIFANHTGEIQARLQPKCGRVVAFRSKGVDNLHGVLGVKKGVRCALPLWFTLSQDVKEENRAVAMHKLHKLKNDLHFKNNQNKKEEL